MNFRLFASCLLLAALTGSPGQATPITSLNGFLFLDGAQGPLNTTLTVRDSTNGSFGATHAIFSGDLALQQLNPSVVFHLGGSLTCPVTAPPEGCGAYNILFGAHFSSDVDIFADQVSFSFDAINRSPFLGPNSQFSIMANYSHYIVPFDSGISPTFYSGIPVPIESGVGFTNGNTTSIEIVPNIESDGVILNPSITSSFPFNGSTQLGGPAINSTEMLFVLAISGLRPGERLDFPNSFTFSILPTASDIPEPATLGLAATAGFLFWALRRRS